MTLCRFRFTTALAGAWFLESKLLIEISPRVTMCYWEQPFQDLPANWLGHDVSTVEGRVDLEKFHAVLFDTVPDVVVLELHVFVPLVLNWIL